MIVSYAVTLVRKGPAGFHESTSPPVAYLAMAMVMAKQMANPQVPNTARFFRSDVPQQLVCHEHWLDIHLFLFVHSFSPPFLLK